MPSLLDVREAYDLVRRFYEETQTDDVMVMLGGGTPDMVDSLIGIAQLSVLGWFMGEVFQDPEHKQSADRFRKTLEGLRERYREKEIANSIERQL